MLVLEKETLPRYKPCGGGVAARTLGQFPFSLDAVFIFGEIQRGYLWVFPKGDHLSVGIGAYRPEGGNSRRRWRV